MKIKDNNGHPLSTFLALSLKEMDQVKLLNRVDSKFIFNARNLNQVLLEVNAHYRVLEIEQKRIFKYESLYFDTADFLLYRHHHNGKPNRVKVRYRKYLDSGETYFEVKKKIKMGRTDKYRIRMPEIRERLGDTELLWMNKHGLNYGPMEPRVRIFFDRITLASKTSCERVTLDVNLLLRDINQERHFPALVIAEVKQERFSRLSKFVDVLRNRNISELAISKYALSVSLMKDVKHNMFKGKMMKLNKIINN